MVDASRSAITNGIWLCRNCHKIVDADAAQFPAELLFEWRREHEQTVLEGLGKAGALLRQKVMAKRLAGFEGCSYLAQQIVIDRPDLWEYRLTAELLHSKLEPIKRRYEALEKGLYALSIRTIGVDDYIAWQGAQLSTLVGQVGAIGGLVNGELQESWGPPGQPGSESEILRMCSLIVEACQRLLEWEESVRFVEPPDAFSEVQALLVGIAGVCIHKVFEIPTWLMGPLSEENPSGTYEFTLVFDLPDQWVENCRRALKRAVAKLA
jgi:hypothetical protein